MRAKVQIRFRFDNWARSKRLLVFAAGAHQVVQLEQNAAQRIENQQLDRRQDVQVVGELFLCRSVEHRQDRVAERKIVALRTEDRINAGQAQVGRFGDDQRGDGNQNEDRQLGEEDQEHEVPVHLGEIDFDQ